jgi:hypothetical protein
MATIYVLATTGGVAPDTANNHTSDSPIAWRLSWSFWLGYATETRKSKPEHLDFTSREGAEAAKAHLARRHASVVACVGSCFVSPSRREREYAALQQKLAEADAWPLQKRPPAKRKRRRPLPYGRRAPCPTTRPTPSA